MSTIHTVEHLTDHGWITWTLDRFLTRREAISRARAFKRDYTAGYGSFRVRSHDLRHHRTEYLYV